METDPFATPGPHRQGLPPGAAATHRPGAAALRVRPEVQRSGRGPRKPSVLGGKILGKSLKNGETWENHGKIVGHPDQNRVFPWRKTKSINYHDTPWNFRVNMIRGNYCWENISDYINVDDDDDDDDDDDEDLSLNKINAPNYIKK